MLWKQLIWAFLAGYGLMSLMLWLFTWLWRFRFRPLTAGAIVLAGNDETRIEGLLRGLHALREEKRLAGIVVRVEGEDDTRAIVGRLANVLGGVSLMPEGASLEETTRAVKGQAIWVLDLKRIPGGAEEGALLAVSQPRGRRRARGRFWSRSRY